MADRLAMVTELGSLTTEATQRGDDRAVDILRRVAGHLMEVHGDLLKLEERRRKDRQRPRRLRTTESADSTESTEKGGFPSDSLSTKKQPAALHRAREAGLEMDLVDSDGVPLAEVDAIDEALAKFAGRHPVAWPAASRFLSRRPLRTWMGWMRQMGKDIGPGSQFTEDDLAMVCDHDEALERPIGSPLGLTSFLGKARQQRLSPPDVRPITDARKGGTVAQRTLDAGRKALGLE